MRNRLPGCWLMSGMGGMVRTGRGRERARAEVAVVRGLEKRLGALPVVAEFGRRLRIAEIVDELCPVRPVAWITHGEVIEALVANRLTAPAPMLRVQDWAAAIAVEEAYGIAPELLNDDRIARALDAVAPQLEAIAGGVGAAAVSEFGVDVSRLHWDLTSISLYGAYPQADEEYPAPRWGHPRDRRPDLKQIQTGLAVSGDGGIPLFHRPYSLSFNQISGRISAYLLYSLICATFGCCHGMTRPFPSCWVLRDIHIRKETAVTATLPCPEWLRQTVPGPDPAVFTGAIARYRALEGLREFRSRLYECLTARPDALFELCDAVLCADHAVTSLVALCLEPEFRRGHGALYGALAGGRIDDERLSALLAETLPQAVDGPEARDWIAEHDMIDRGLLEKAVAGLPARDAARVRESCARWTRLRFAVDATAYPR